MHFWHKAEGVNGLKSKNTIFDGIPTYSVFNFPSKTPALTTFLKHQRAGNLQCIHNLENFRKGEFIKSARLILLLLL